MTFPLQKLLYPFLLPSGALFTAAVLLLSRDRLPDAVEPFLGIFPPAIIAIAVLLGWRFNRSRLLYAIILLILAERSLAFLGTTATGTAVFLVICLTLPCNLLLVALFHERGLVNLRGALWIGFIGLQVIGFSWLHAHHRSQLLSWLNHRLVPLPAAVEPAIGQPALLAFFFCLAGLALRFYLRPAALDASFFWATLALLFGLLDYGIGQPLTLYFAAAGLILVVGVVETSHSMAYRDELTGLPERRALNEALAKQGSLYTVAMLDIDHFKKFNDTHGHDVGDQVLKMVASKLANITGGGKTYRYGGEEFSVIFPRTAVEDALPHLETLRETVAASTFIPRGKDRPKKKPKQPRTTARRSPALSVTISIGAAQKQPKLSTAEDVIKAADRALYRAKSGGRNRVCA